ncbi:MAG TPA: PQQ-binding-like beta-propeller repeat protein, partial [Ktedonobacterales bacterium]
MSVSEWRGRWMRAAPVLVVLLVLLACAAPLSIGGPGTSQGHGTPCATNTPHATLAQGDRILALVFLGFSPQTAGTATAASGATSNTSEMVCILRAGDGALVAHYDIGATGVDVMPSGSLLAVAPDSSMLYVSSISPETQSSKLCAIVALTGKVLWCTRMVGYIEQAAVGNGALYLLENGTLEALEAMNGAVLWQRSGFDWDQLQPIVLDGDRIYAPTSDGVTDSDALCAFRTKDGTAAWCTH